MHCCITRLLRDALETRLEATLPRFSLFLYFVPLSSFPLCPLLPPSSSCSLRELWNSTDCRRKTWTRPLKGTRLTFPLLSSPLLSPHCIPVPSHPQPVSSHPILGAVGHLQLCQPAGGAAAAHLRLHLCPRLCAGHHRQAAPRVRSPCQSRTPARGEGRWQAQSQACRLPARALCSTGFPARALCSPGFPTRALLRPFSLVWKCARIGWCLRAAPTCFHTRLLLPHPPHIPSSPPSGERLSPWVSLACLAMAAHRLLFV